jgi:hypothetical protein
MLLTARGRYCDNHEISPRCLPDARRKPLELLDIVRSEDSRRVDDGCARSWAVEHSCVDAVIDAVDQHHDRDSCDRAEESPRRDDRTEETTGDEASDVCEVGDQGFGEPEGHLPEGPEADCRSDASVAHLHLPGVPAQHGDQAAHEPEDRAGGSDRRRRFDCGRHDASSHAGSEVDAQHPICSEGVFAGDPEDEQGHHVAHEVPKSAVQEHAAEQPPDLPVKQAIPNERAPANDGGLVLKHPGSNLPAEGDAARCDDGEGRGGRVAHAMFKVDAAACSFVREHVG